MNKLQEKIQSVASTLANSMVDKETREWPPACLFFTYQPMRPETEQKEDNNSSAE